MPKNVKNTTIISLLDLIAPHSCRGCGHIGHVLCNRCKNNIITQHETFCPNCKSAKTTSLCSNCPDLPPIYIGGERSGLLDILIHDYKYHSVRSLAFPLAEILSHAIPPIEGEVIIVPLPTIGRHIRERGLDHTLLIAQHLARIRGPKYHVQSILVRNNNCTQVGASRTTRLQQASQAYQLNPRFPINPQASYLLLDDVWTTGASLRSAQQKLTANGATKTSLAILAVSRIN